MVWIKCVLRKSRCRIWIFNSIVVNNFPPWRKICLVLSDTFVNTPTVLQPIKYVRFCLSKSERGDKSSKMCLVYIWDAVRPSTATHSVLSLMSRIAMSYTTLVYPTWILIKLYPFLKRSLSYLLYVAARNCSTVCAQSGTYLHQFDILCNLYNKQWRLVSIKVGQTYR